MTSSSSSTATSPATSSSFLEETVCLDILRVIKEKQQQNGMSYGDYERYRHYCARKLRSLRAQLRITHGNGGRRKKQQLPQSQTNKNKNKNNLQKKGQKNILQKKKVVVEEDPEYAFIHRRVTGTGTGTTSTVEASSSINSSTTVEDRKRLFMFVLMQAERAWIYAMELKQQQQNSSESAGGVEPTRKRFHCRKRMRKAVMWSGWLAEATAAALEGAMVDERTVLEAEAYHQWMSANLSMEHEDFKTALDKYLHARAFYAAMAQALSSGVGVSSVAEREPYKVRVEEIDNTIRACRYRLAGATASTSTSAAGDDDEQLLLKQMRDKVHSALQKRAAAAVHAPVVAAAAAVVAVDEVKWNGRVIPVDNDKVRHALTSVESWRQEAAAAAVHQQDTSASSKTRLYDRMRMSLNDCQKWIRDDLKSSVPRSDEQIANLRQLYGYVMYLTLLRTVERNCVMAQQMVVKLEEKQGGAAAAAAARSGDHKLSASQRKAKKSGTSAVDVVHLYEVVLQHLGDIVQLISAEHDQHAFKLFSCMQASYKALRCFYLAEAHAQTNEWRESHVLLGRAQRLADVAKASQQAVRSSADSASVDLSTALLLPDMDTLSNKIVVAQLHSKAQFVISQQQKQVRVGGQTQKLPAQKHDVLSHVNEFHVEPRGRLLLASVPPKIEPVPSKPAFFDISSNYVQYPLDEVKSKFVQEGDLEVEEQGAETVPKKKGWFGLW